MKTRKEVATEKFLAGYNCAQSVLYAYADELNLDKETALKVAAGLGGGMARRGEICGALAGGILAIGLKYGRGQRDDRSATERTYKKAQELMACFEQQCGSCRCRDLLQGCDLRTPEGQQHFRKFDLLHKVCLPCVQGIVGALAGILSEPATPSVDARKP